MFQKSLFISTYISLVGIIFIAFRNSTYRFNPPELLQNIIILIMGTATFFIILTAIFYFKEKNTSSTFEYKNGFWVVLALIIIVNILLIKPETW